MVGTAWKYILNSNIQQRNSFQKKNRSVIH